MAQDNSLLKFQKITKKVLKNLKADESYVVIQHGSETIMYYTGKKFEDNISEQPSNTQPTDILLPTSKTEKEIWNEAVKATVAEMKKWDGTIPSENERNYMAGEILKRVSYKSIK